MTAPDFSVPIDDLQPRTYERLPNGKYLGTVTFGPARPSAKNPGWRAVEVPVTDITTPDGKNEVEKRGSTEPVRLTGQSRRTVITVENPTSEQNVEIGRRQLTGLAYALGIAQLSENGDGKTIASFPHTS